MLLLHPLVQYQVTPVVGYKDIRWAMKKNTAANPISTRNIFKITLYFESNPRSNPVSQAAFKKTNIITVIIETSSRIAIALKYMSIIPLPKALLKPCVGSHRA